MAAPTHETAMAWYREGQAVVDAAVAGLPDEGFGQPSLLPGWSRAYVVAHLARNADACVNLLTWARTGHERRMYPSAEARNADIAAGALQDPESLRGDLRASAERLEAAVVAMTAEAWAAPVLTNAGRSIPAADVAWMRTREVWIHAVDLDAGPTWAALPGPLVDALVDEVTETFGGRPDVAPVELVAEARGRRWQVGGGNGPTVTGEASDLVAWLLGRSDGTGLAVSGGEALPDLGRWL